LNSAAGREVLDISQFKPQLQRLESAEFLAGALVAITDKSSIFSNSVTPLNDNTQPLIRSNNLSSEIQQGEMQRHCGTLAHLYMALFATSDLQDWHAERIAACLPAMQKWLMLQGHAAEASRLGASQVLDALQTTLASKDGQWVLQKHTNASSELSVMQATDDGVKKHVIDRTFVENGMRWIVDYKLTGADENKDLTLVAEQHRAQLERYAGLFAREGLPMKCAIYFLDSGNLVELMG
jgi:ATP-dependent exoDNAse (exonuclease V) beta subunit